jgi:hypothetical protein
MGSAWVCTIAVCCWSASESKKSQGLYKCYKKGFRKRKACAILIFSGYLPLDLVKSWHNENNFLMGQKSVGHLVFPLWDKTGAFLPMERAWE